MTLLAGVILGGAAVFMLLMAIGLHLIARQQLVAPRAHSRNAQAFGPV